MATLTLRREDGRVVCERCVVANRPYSRARGLLGRRRLQPGEGMVLRPAWGVHTAFMRFPIDVIFLDRDGFAVKLVSDLPPWRLAAAARAHAVVEMAAGSLRRHAVALGDRLYLKV